jgi:hypothetical protein
MSVQRQKNQQPEQGVLAFPVESRSDAPMATETGTETLMAKGQSESLAGTERLMEEVCEWENCKQALQRVKANKGKPGVDGMTVDELPAAFHSTDFSGVYKALVTVFRKTQL